MAGPILSLDRSFAHFLPAYPNLVEYRAGRMTMCGQTLCADPQEGLLYVYEDDVGFIHFCWKNLSTNKVEDKIIIFTKSFEFKRMNQCKIERSYQLEFKWTSDSHFYWMQEPNVDKDVERCYRINEIIKSPPRNFYTGWYKFIPHKYDFKYLLDISIERFREQRKWRLFYDVTVKNTAVRKPPCKYLSTVPELGGYRASLTICTIDSGSSSATATAELTSNIYPALKKKKFDDTSSPMEFSDMCDDVIDMILCKLDFLALANISDTNNRLRNIAASVFCRKFGEHVIAFDAFSYSFHTQKPILEEYRFQEFAVWKHKPLIRISVANIWFKVLRNFGSHIKIVRIESSQDKSNIYQLKIPYALWYLMKYVLDYCSESLEMLDLLGYPFFKLDKPLTKLHTFIAEGGWRNCCRASWKHWNTNALDLMPKLRTLRLDCVPIIIEKHLPKLERMRLELKSDDDVRSFISFLQLNQHINYLDLCCLQAVREHTDRIYSAIEENLTQLKTLKIFHPRSEHGIFNPMGLIRDYHFKSVESFEYRNCEMLRLQHSFEFNDLKKLEIFMLNEDWVNFIRNNKNLKMFKMKQFYVDEEDVYMREVVQSSELEQIIVKLISERDNAILKSILGSEWEDIAVFKEFRKESRSPSILFNVKYQRVLQRKI